MEFEWDEAKHTTNLRKHGVDFGEAASTFYDPLALMRLDRGHSETEERFMLLGRSPRGRLLMTIFVEIGSTIRILSSRRATTREVKGYEEGI